MNIHKLQSHKYVCLVHNENTKVNRVLTFEESVHTYVESTLPKVESVDILINNPSAMTVVD